MYAFVLRSELFIDQANNAYFRLVLKHNYDLQNERSKDIFGLISKKLQ